MYSTVLNPKFPVPRSYVAAVAAPVPIGIGAKLDLKSIPIIDIPLPLKQPHMKDGLPAMFLTPLELQRIEALFQHALIESSRERGPPWKLYVSIFF